MEQDPWKVKYEVRVGGTYHSGVVVLSHKVLSFP